MRLIKFNKCMIT